MTSAIDVRRGLQRCDGGERWRRFLARQAATPLAPAKPPLRVAGGKPATRRPGAAGTGFFVWALVTFATLLAAAPVRAAPEIHADRREASASGALQLRTQTGQLLDAPRVDTTVRVTVTGQVVRAYVTQDFVNPTDTWLEGLYTFPLAATAAVDELEMKVGERVVRGQIREREAARRAFVAAAAAGKRASLVEQQRPNLFTTAVANIAPRAKIRVTIGYLETAEYRDGQYRLHVPLAITPRYQPDAENSAVDPAAALTHNVAPGAQRASVEVELRPGFALGRLESPHHVTRIEQTGSRARITLGDGPVPQDRDFELVWAPAAEPRARAAAFVERFDSESFALITLTPPATQSVNDVPREVIFVIDTSGSMEGPSIVQARLALQLALRDLDARDSFTVIRFSSDASSLYPAPMPADDERRREAHAYVGSLDADGGTEMMNALQMALAMPRDTAKLRQIVFITDGAVSNDSDIVALLRAELGDGRLFTVGIGAAPNAYFMQEAAAAGRGSYTFVADPNQLVERIGSLVTKLSQPALTHLEIHWPAGVKPDLALPLPGELYVGDPITLVARTPQPLGGTLTLTGRSNGAAWSHQVPIEVTSTEPGIAKLWGRERIRALERSTQSRGGADEQRGEVIRLSMRHHLVSRYTSLLAVDETPVAPAGAPMGAAAIPATAPAGSAWATTGFATTATPAPAWFGLGAALLMLGAGLALVGRGRGAR